MLNGCTEPWKSQIDEYISQNMQTTNVNFINTEQGGVSNARNMALDVAKGEYITFIDDDDYVSPSYLEEMYSMTDGETIICAKPIAFIDKTGEKVNYRIENEHLRHAPKGRPKASKVRKFFSGPCMKLIPMNFIQAKLSPIDTEGRAKLTDSEFLALKEHDLTVLITPYLVIAAIIAVMFLVILFARMPKNADQNHSIDFLPTLRRIFNIKHYREGVVAQFFYVGAQIMCWTFIIQYGTHYFMLEGMDERSAEVLSQQFNIYAMIFFCCSRFICTFFLKYINPGKLLFVLASAAIIFVIGVIMLRNSYGVYCLVAISGCMSLMFPTIYGIALQGLGDDAKFGAAGLIMAILGGSVLPPLQASIIDMGTLMSVPAVNISFVLPLICFIVVAIYGKRMGKKAE